MEENLFISNNFQKVYAPLLNYGIWSKKTLNWIFDIKINFFRFSTKKIHSRIMIGWGRKQDGKLAIKLINRHLDYWLIEDGFVRSYKAGSSFPSLSYVIDKEGIYYDDSQTSSLEKIINSDLSSKFKSRSFSEEIRTLLLQNKLSKYNVFIETRIKGISSENSNNILIVDQTYGDLSVQYGRASPDSFSNMVDAALMENPSATIFIKTHPEVTSGRKKGYLTHIQDSDRIVMIRDNINPIDLIQRMDKVYVVTSQMGFEALMCGKPVVCFGVPWYAGWGLTDDRVKDSPAWARRTKKRTVDELFAAAYIHYTRYLNPFTHKRGEIMDVINWLILQKKMAPNPFIREFSNTNV